MQTFAEIIHYYDELRESVAIKAPGFVLISVSLISCSSIVAATG